MRTISSVRDLSEWVSELMGQNATDEIVERVVGALRSRSDRPDYGADWSEWMEPFDLWQIERDTH